MVNKSLRCGTAPVVRAADRDYVSGSPGGVTMPDTVSSERSVPVPLVLLAAVVGVLLATTIVLWAHYGGAVFLEIIAAGIASCF
jgi:hypothetical protein